MLCALARTCTHLRTMRQSRSALGLLLLVAGILAASWLPAAGARRAGVQPQGPRPTLPVLGSDANPCDNGEPEGAELVVQGPVCLQGGRSLNCGRLPPPSVQHLGSA